MTRFVGTPLRGIEFSSPSDEAISARVVGDSVARIRIDAGGRLTWSSGAATGDVNLYRDSANTLKTDDALVASGGVTTITTNGAPSLSAPDGTLAIDTTNDVFYFRSGSTWLEVSSGASVVISGTAPTTPDTGSLWYNSSTSVLSIYDGTDWVSVTGSLTLEGLSDVTITSPVSYDVLTYNGTEWVNSPSFTNSAPIYSETFGDGSATQFTLTHMFGTRDVLVVVRNASSPYEVVDVAWSATTIDTITINTSVAPASNSLRATVYAGGGISGVTTVAGTANEIDVDQTTGSVHVGLVDDVVVSSSLTAPLVNADAAQFDTSVGVPAASEGKLQWNSDFGTLSFGLDGNNSLHQIGINQFAYCYNADSVTLAKGTPVYIFGGQGSQVSIKRAQNTGDATSATTLGLVSESIAASGSGYVCTYGVLQGIDTTAYNEGDILYLGATAGSLTTTKPSAPNHGVFVGVVIKEGVGGEIWVRPQNGYELDEIHNVSAASPSNGDFLKYNGTLWVNDPINLGTDTVGNYVSDITAGTGVTVTHTPSEGSSPTVAIGQAVGTTDNVQFNDVTVSGNLTVSGTTTTLNTAELTVEDTVITLNAGAASGADSGIEVDRGSGYTPKILWDESAQKWTFSNNGSTFVDFQNITALDQVDDVVLTSPTSGQFLKYDGTNWVNDNVPIIDELDDVGDVALSSPANGEVLKYNGTNWVNSPSNKFSVADTLPINPLSGDMWFESDSGSTFVYFDSQWIEIGGSSRIAVNTQNLIINGAMQVSQRAAVGTAVSSSSGGYHTADRWDRNMTTFGTWNQTTIAEAPTGSGFRNSLKLSCTATHSPSAGHEMQIRQKIEGQNLQSIRKGTPSAQQVTLSFWVRAHQTGTFICELEDQDNNRNVSKSYTINASGTWEYKSLTFPADTTGAFDNDNNSSLAVIWWLGSGTNFTSGTLATSWATPTSANRAVGQTNVASSTSNYWQITGVQFNVGAVAAPFEAKSYSDELRECQRYYYRRTATVTAEMIISGYQPAGTNIVDTWFHPVPMRTSPSLAAFGGTWSAVNTAAGPYYSNVGANGMNVYITVNGAITNANQSSRYSETGAYIEVGAEL
jgi:hypothetical protein